TQPDCPRLKAGTGLPAAPVSPVPTATPPVPPPSPTPTGYRPDAHRSGPRLRPPPALPDQTRLLPSLPAPQTTARRDIPGHGRQRPPPAKAGAPGWDRAEKDPARRPLRSVPASADWSPECADGDSVPAETGRGWPPPRSDARSCPAPAGLPAR